MSSARAHRITSPGVGRTRAPSWSLSRQSWAPQAMTQPRRSGKHPSIKVGVPWVYAAAEGALDELGFLADVFARLHLGYMRASAGDGAVAEIEARPSESPFLRQHIHDENTARIRLLDLWSTAIFPGAQQHRGRDQRPDFWVVTERGGWQLCAQ